MRPIPLKIAGVTGMLVTAVYLVAATGEDGPLGSAIVWLVVMGAASGLAWFADRFPGRAAAIIASGLFFALGVLFPLGLALVFLSASLLCLVGFVYLPGMGERARNGAWRVVGYRGSGEERSWLTPVASGGHPILVIEGANVSGTMGLNRFTGRIGPKGAIGPLATTRTTGDPEMTAQDDRLVALIEEADSIDVDGDGMTLTQKGLKVMELQRVEPGGDVAAS